MPEAADEALVQEYDRLREYSKDKRVVVLTTLPVLESTPIRRQKGKTNFVHKWAHQYRERVKKLEHDSRSSR